MGTLVQSKKIALSDLSHLKSRVTISDDVGAPKPDPKIFLHAMRAAGFLDTDVGTTLMIGDNLKADIYGAHQLGIDTVWYDRRDQGQVGGHHKCQP